MADKFLLTIQFKKQGAVKGSSTKKDGDLDYSKGMECHGFDYGVVAPVDTGHATGKRAHKPIIVSREVDVASPLLLHAWSANDTFDKATFTFHRPAGKPSVVHTIELARGVILNIKPVTDSSGKKYENVTLAYEELRVNGTLSGIIPASWLQSVAQGSS